MVASENDDLLGIPNFKSEKKANDFATLLASVDIVPHKEVLGVSANNHILLLLLILVTHLFKHMQQIGVLTVDVPEYFHGSFEI